MRTPSRRAGLGLAAAAVTVLGVVPFASSAGAATAPAPASAFGAGIQANGQDVVPPTPAAAVTTVPGDQTKTAVNVPASPVIVNGTLTATANVHRAADIPTGLTVVPQAIAGPYNGRGLGQIEGAAVLYEVAGKGVPLLSASVIRSEAAAICGASTRYTASSEIVDLKIAGTSVPVNAPVQQLIDGISSALTGSGLNAVVDVKRNVVTQIAGGGVGVDALVVTLLSAAGATPLAQIRLAHAEVTAGACASLPQCSDGIDNDGDGKVDAADPGCHSDGNAANAATYVPSDNDERDVPQCSDGIDNDGDGKVDAADPGCHSDGNAANPASYVPSDNDERDAAALAANAGAQLPATGGNGALPIVGGALLGAAALGLVLRRRTTG